MKIILFCTCVVTVLGSVMNAPAARQDNAEDIANNTIAETQFRIVSRDEWGARPPTTRAPLQTPVAHVVLHHTYIPGACASLEQCASAMRSMQRYHMDDNHWADIGYNFCVGGDGVVYEGRGWSTHGAHAGPTANGVSQGICLIGDWTVELPPRVQLDVAKALIRRGVELGYIQAQYTLIGHRQVRHTECPGDALFGELSTWEHFSAHPSSPDEPLHAPASAAAASAIPPPSPPSVANKI